jgi:hypothetical protein
VIEFRDWCRGAHFPDKPWLILGKGPSFRDRHLFDLTAFNTLALNHAVGEQPSDVAHMIDLDVAEALGERLLDNCTWLLMPRHPHLDFRATTLELGDFLDSVPVLRRLDEQGRLVVYDLASTERAPRGPLIRTHSFSSVAALDLLGHMGCREARSLGVDGGVRYSGEFAHLSTTTRLANGLPSFSEQLPELARVAREHEMRFEPLSDPLRVFVGADDSQVIPAKVLEHSIHKHASRHVEVQFLLGLETPMPKDEVNRPRTAFSFNRFHIPGLAGYKGRALYVDSDMQVFADLASLWDIPFGDAKIMCTYQDTIPEQWKDNNFFHPGRQMSVMMLDCERLPWDVRDIVGGLDEGRYTYQQLMFEMCLVQPEEINDALPSEWNHLEHFEPGETKLLHYTAVTTQPWRNNDNPLRGVWEQAFVEAVKDGAVTVDEVRLAVRHRYVKKELLQLAMDASPDGRPPRAAVLVELEALRSIVNARPGRVAKVAKRVALAKVRAATSKRR